MEKDIKVDQKHTIILLLSLKDRKYIGQIVVILNKKESFINSFIQYEE